ncbi:uncharacterized protein [Clytia hemisphaerica]|uniref:uncharacterized protein isoform X2 n=1 Tax=Clytia hemisphaerica TaxID=252671 RepID=UPI0034D3CB9E
MEEGSKEKVDVSLQWLDFIHAFKDVQYNYTHKKQDRDWFRLNSIDIFLLGCETLVDNEQRKSKLNNIIISMVNLQPLLLEKPSMLEDVTICLFDLIQFESHVNSKTANFKRLSTLISGIIGTSRDRLQLLIHPLVYRLLKNNQEFVQLECIAKWLKEVGQSLTKGFPSKSSPDPALVEVNYLRYLFQRLHSNESQILKYDWVEELLTSNVSAESLKYLFRLIDTIVIFHEKIDEESSETPELDDDFLFAYGEWLLALVKDSVDDDSSFEWLLKFLYMDLTSRIRKVESMEGFLDLENTKMVIEILFDYAKVFEDGMKSKVLQEIFNFLCSGLETNVERNILLSVHLPNITAMGFGFKDGELTCLLLQYGALSFSSKHQKNLLKSSLSFIKSVHSLFETEDKIRKENDLIKTRMESISVVLQSCDQIIMNVLSKDKGQYLEAPRLTEVTEDEKLTSNVESLSTKITTDSTAITSSLVNSNSSSITHESSADTLNSTREMYSDSKDYLTLLKLLVNLACIMIKRGENINYCFASILPKLFYRSDFPVIPAHLPLKYFPRSVTRSTTLPWKVPKHMLALDTLRLCVLCYDRQLGGSNMVFQICSVMIPKLIRNLDRTGLKDDVKFSILKEFIVFCKERMETSQQPNISTLVTHGLDLVSMLMPDEKAEKKTLKQFLISVSQSVEKLSGSSSLLLLKTSCELLMQHLPSESQQIKSFFLFLVKRCNRNDIRNVFLMSRDWLAQQPLAHIRQLMYSYCDKKINAKALQTLSEVMTTLISVENLLKTAYPQLKDHISLLPIVSDFDHSNTKTRNQALKKILRISLYQSLVPEKLEKCLGVDSSSVFCLMDDLECEFPGEIARDDGTMSWLQMCTRRINQMQIPRYIKLQELLNDLMKKFISKDLTVSLDKIEISYESDQDLKELLNQRHQIFQDHIDNLPWNVEKRNNLIEKYEYHNSFWDTENHHELEVSTDGELNLEENLRQSLLSCYTEYVEILNSLDIASIVVDGETVKCSDIFSDELSLVNLKGRRSIVVKTIDKQINGMRRNLLDKKFALQMQEEKIEEDLKTMASKPKTKQLFQIQLQTSFFDCSKCCGANIIGCYSPAGGEHCERPLEIGFRNDSGFISIYHKDVEIENCEFLLTNQGLLLYKAYSSGHPYDTSEIWIEFFLEIIERKELLPAIILPYHFPNKASWERLRHFVSPNIVGSFISCDYDYSTEWRTYYDSRPETFGNGKDIYLTKGFMNRERKASFSFQRQISINTDKDLGGILSERIMSKLVNDKELQAFRFLGKQFVLLLNHLLECGGWEIGLLSDQFHFDRWKERNSSTNFTSKDDVINALNHFLLVTVKEYISSLDFEKMLFLQKRQFHQLRSMLMKNSKTVKLIFDEVPSYLFKMNTAIQSHLSYVRMDSLSDAMQDEVMYWIFENEDRVWRFRGGRDFETISQFLSFLPRHSGEKRCFPGVLIYLHQDNPLLNTDTIQISNIVGYAIGEYVAENDDEDEKENVNQKVIDEDVYEIVTAWIHPNYRGLALSTEVYLQIFRNTTSNYVIFDLLRHRIEHVIKSSKVLKMLAKGLTNCFTVEKSYEVNTANGLERFEKVTVSRYPVALVLQMSDFWVANKLFALSIFVLLISFLFYLILSILY